MSSADNGNKERNRQIARNEEMRQTIGAVRVSGWAIVFAIILGVIVVAIAWAWLNR
jgi:tetrahydromethanopterin S-methyltransferase subunit F